METTSTYEPGTGANNTGESAPSQAKQQLHEVTQQAKDAAGNLADQARTQVKSQLTNQKERAAESLGGVAEALRATGDQLNQREQPVPVGRYAEQAADMVEQMAGYLRSKDIDQIVGQAEDLARQRPAVFLGAAFAIGFMAARFLKSTAPTGPSRSYEGYAQGGRSHARYDAPYYREHETIGEAELHERQGYPLKTAAERAQERQSSQFLGGGDAGGAFGYRGAPEGSGTDLTGDLDDDYGSSDFVETTRVRSSDV